MISVKSSRLNKALSYFCAITNILFGLMMVCWSMPWSETAITRLGEYHFNMPCRWGIAFIGVTAILLGLLFKPNYLKQTEL